MVKKGAHRPGDINVPSTPPPAANGTNGGSRPASTASSATGSDTGSSYIPHWVQRQRQDALKQKLHSRSRPWLIRLAITSIVFALACALHYIGDLIRVILFRIPAFLFWHFHYGMLNLLDHTPTPTEKQNLEAAEKLGLLTEDGVDTSAQMNSKFRTRAAVVNTWAEAVPRWLPEHEVKQIYNVEGFCLPPFDQREVYQAPLWNRHVSTILANLRPVLPHKYFRESFTSWDGCTLCLDWAYAEPASLQGIIATGSPTGSESDKLNKAVKGVILVIPGLASSAETCYIECCTRAIVSNGYHAAVLNARGMGTTPLNVPRVVDGVNTNDIRYAVNFMSPERLARDHGIPIGTPLFVVGHSLGGSLLCKYLGEEGKKLGTTSDADDHPPLDNLPHRRISAAFADCTPWDFHETHHHMMRLESRLIYQQHLTDGLIEYLENHIDTVRSIPHFDIDHLLSRGLRKVQDYDEHIASPHCGFACKEEYYTASMSMPFLEYIRVPTLALISGNDPITGPDPADQRWEKIIAKNPFLSYARFPVGGHLAFLQGYVAEMTLQTNPMERAFVAHFDHVLARQTSTRPNTNAPPPEMDRSE